MYISYFGNGKGMLRGSRLRFGSEGALCVRVVYCWDEYIHTLLFYIRSFRILSAANVAVFGN